MDHGNAIRGIYNKRLGILNCAVADCWIPNLANADVALKLQHMLLAENISNQAHPLLKMKLLIVSDNAGRILPAVLQANQAFVNFHGHFAIADNADDSAHILVTRN